MDAKIQENFHNSEYIIFENAWKIYLNVQDMIKFADQKVNILLIICGLFLSFALNKIQNIQNFNYFNYFSFTIFSIALLFTILFCLLSIFARRDTKTGKTVPQLIYFGHIAKRREAVEYIEAMKNTNTEETLRDLYYQIYEVSNIALKKYTNYKIAWVGIFVEAVFFILFMLSLI